MGNDLKSRILKYEYLIYVANLFDDEMKRNGHRLRALDHRVDPHSRTLEEVERLTPLIINSIEASKVAFPSFDQFKESKRKEVDEAVILIEDLFTD